MTLAINIREQPRQTFFGEALELSRQIEEGLVNLLQDRSACQIHALVRAAHSLKGGAAQVNLNNIQKLSYRLEKIFSALRQKNVEIDVELVGLLEQAYEFLRLQILAEIEQSDYLVADSFTKAELVFEVLEKRLGQNLVEEFELPTASELGVDLKKFILNTEVALALEQLEEILTKNEFISVGELKSQLDLFIGFGEFLEICEFVDIACNVIATIPANARDVRIVGNQTLLELRGAWEAASKQYLPTESQKEEIFEPDAREDENLAAFPSLDDIFEDFVPQIEQNFYAEAKTNFEPITLQIKDTFEIIADVKLSTRGLLVWQTGSNICTLPCNAIAEHLTPVIGQVIELHQQRFLIWRQQIIPIYQLAKLLQHDRPVPGNLEVAPSASGKSNKPLPMLIVTIQEKTIALETAIERLIAAPELKIKTFNRAIGHPSYFYGCAVAEDSALLPAIDLIGLLERTVDLEESIAQERAAVSARVDLPTFLIVDDSDSWRQTVSFTLKRAGYRVLSAEDGQQGIEQLKENTRIHGIISDVEMPGLNGFEFLSHLLQDPELSKIPVVMLSSCNTNKHRQLAKQLGASAYLTKPFNEQEFLATLKACIASKELFAA